jgi:flagellar hook-associated protein 1 FlgK
MGLSAAMDIGKNGLTVYRVATEVTGENIANVNTPGYSRQRVILESAPPTTANGFPLGTGVKIATVERVYDALLQQQRTNSQTTLGFDTTKSNVLQQIEPAFNEVANDGIGAAISNFFGAWQDLTVNPTGTTERQSVISNAQILADDFHVMSRTLTDTINLQNSALQPLVDSVNASLANIAQLNGQIKATELVAGNANEMRDQRDQLIRDLSQKIGITYTENPDGMTDIRFADSGGALVTGATAGAFSLDKTNPNSYVVQLTPVGGVVAAVAPTTGELGATLALRDTIIPGYLAQIDTLATSITTMVNTQHMAGFDLGGNPGIALFDPAATNAATFGLNPAIVNTDLIAASSSALLIGDNGNAQLIAKMQNQKLMAGGTLTFNGYYDSLVSQVGLAVSSSKTTVSQDEAFSKQLNALWESTSGVSLDEELTNLIKYQRSYEASAKLITTATEMLDTVLGLIR